ncbi:FAD-dependent oxidoreductase [Streptomyces sp. NPDC013740]|uniref:FAD-dependent oxidoreductase n=1 Tax=Streptomyces sp. NPDC013740 TaxID=3364867 RepID=UPI0037032529
MPGADVCVVGGPVGLTLAIALRRPGLGVRVVDRAPAAKREARALVVWPRAAEALGALGVLGPLGRQAVELGEVTIHGRGRPLGELVTGWHRSAHRRPLNIEQHDIERLLYEQPAGLGTEVEWDTEVTDVKDHDDRAEFTLRLPDASAESATASWIVGCEGTAKARRVWSATGSGSPSRGGAGPACRSCRATRAPTGPWATARARIPSGSTCAGTPRATAGSAWASTTA